MKILNLTQHEATLDQLDAGVVNLQGEDLQILKDLLTFKELPSKNKINSRARSIAALALLQSGVSSVMIGGAPYLMGPLERAITLNNKSEWLSDISVVYAYSDRVSVETKLDNGTTKKTMMFRHIGFVEV